MLSSRVAPANTSPELKAALHECPDPAAVQGTLAGLSDERISIARKDERAGEVHVHFPRMGQILAPV